MPSGFPRCSCLGRSGNTDAIASLPSGKPAPQAQRAVGALELRAIQFRLATSSAGRLERFEAALTLAAHLECPSDSGQNLTGTEQLGGLLAPLFQGLEISAGTQKCFHSIRDTRDFTIICEIQ